MKTNSRYLAVILWVICLYATLMQAALAEDKAAAGESLLDHLVGKWVMTGTMMNKPAVHDVEAEWVLQHQYVLLRDVAREKNEKGAPEYESSVYICWDAKAKGYRCVALDNFGGISPMTIGRAKPTDDAIPFAFRDGDSTFTDIFTYISANDTWTWKLDFDQKGTVTPYGRVTLERVK